MSTETSVGSQVKSSGFHYAYLIVVACCAGVVPVSLGLSCAGLLFASIAETMQVGPGLISNYITTLMLVAAIWLPFAGRLFAKVDARIMTSISAAAIGAGMFVCSLATSPAIIFVGGAIVGFGIATQLYLSGPVLVNRWFVAKRAAFFVAVVTAFMGISTAVVSPVIGSLLLSVGWQTTFKIMAAIALVVSLPFTIFVIRSNPADKGLLPCGSNPSDEVAKDAREAAGVSASVAFKSPAFILLAALVLVICLGLYAQTMNPNYIRQLPISQNIPMLFSFAASALMVAQVVGKLAIGATAEKRPLVIGAAALAIGIAGFALNIAAPDSSVAIIVAAALIGVCTSLANVLMPAITRRFFGMKDYSSIYAIIGTMMSVGGVLQAPVLGTLLDVAGYQALQFAFIGLAIVAIAMLVIVMRVGDTFAKKHGLLKESATVEKAQTSALADNTSA